MHRACVVVGEVRRRRPSVHDEETSREQLEQHLYSWGQEVDSNAIEVHIHHLRRKLGAASIQTVRGLGYLLLREGLTP